MAKWDVELVGKDTGRIFKYGVAFAGEATNERVFFAALAAHGQMILTGQINEPVHGDRGKVRRAD